MRVLVVEDEVRLAATLRDLLELNGYTVDVCHDGEAGLDNALSAIYDVILLDVMLPKLDGFTLLRRLRARTLRGFFNRLRGASGSPEIDWKQSDIFRNGGMAYAGIGDRGRGAFGGHPSGPAGDGRLHRGRLS